MSKIATVLIAGLLSNWQEDATDNPEFTGYYKDWIQCKEGSWIKKKQYTNMGEFWVKLEHTFVYKGVKKDDRGDYATFDYSSGVEGEKPKGRITELRIYAKGKKEQAKSDKGAAKPEEGDEELEIAGKKYKCHWVRTTSLVGGEKETTTIWMNDDIPGRIAKSQASEKGTIVAKEWLVAFEKK
jgi:hypothetical protein